VTTEEQTAMNPDSIETLITTAPRDRQRSEVELVSFTGAAVVQLLIDDPLEADAEVLELHEAVVTVTNKRILATGGDTSWSWLLSDLEAVIHGSAGTWTIFIVPEIPDFGVLIPADRVDEFRPLFAKLPGVEVRHQENAKQPDASMTTDADWDIWAAPTTETPIIPATEPVLPQLQTSRSPRSSRSPRPPSRRRQRTQVELMSAASTLTGIDARNITAWFGSHMVLDRVSLEMAAGEVTALIGPSGCGKSTFLRILNRMHEMIPSASLAGEVLLDGHDIYDPNRKLTDARREIGMVFQKPNPFPAMSIYDNVLASLRLTGVKASVEMKDEIVESCLSKAGLWKEVRDRLREPGGGLSGGQQQRLCIARALAIRPRVLLMDEPCSALDPTSTRRIEETVMELVSEVTIVIVTHNMQQAARVSNRCAFFLAEQGTPGIIVEHGPTSAMFNSPQDPRTNDYVNGRFG